MSEDCLSINVWTSASSASAKLPVMVWSYGGAFTGGAGSLPGYDGEALARKGVVFVTYNYRLGPFGFYAHPELTRESGHNASGNYGVMDLAAALKWVQTNIAAFGGDPGRVTLVGESAGAALESVLAGSKEGRGLYHRVIAESASWSGVRMEKMQTLAEAEQAGKDAAAKTGASTIAELRARPADEIMKMPGGRPIVDGWYVTEDLSITYARSRQADVDVLVGSNENEAGFPFFGVPRGHRGGIHRADQGSVRRSIGGVSQTVSGRVGRRVERRAGEELQRRGCMEHAVVGAVAVEAAQREGVPLLLHQGAARER
jgi:para-nitrobenzyl esterase